MASSKSFLNKFDMKIIYGIIAVLIIAFGYSKTIPKEFACVYGPFKDKDGIYRSDKLAYAILKVDKLWKRMTFYPKEPWPGKHEGIKMGPYPYQRTKRGDHYVTRPFFQKKLTKEEQQLKKRKQDEYFWMDKVAIKKDLEMWLSRTKVAVTGPNGGFRLEIVSSDLQSDDKFLKVFTCYPPRVKKKKYFKKQKKYDL